MVKLHFGVTDLPYSGPALDPKIKRVAVRTARGNGKDKAAQTYAANPAALVTTGEVAEILEAEYGIMQFFWNRYGPQIVGSYEESLERHLEAVAAGLPTPPDPLAATLQKAESLFRDMIDRRELDGQVPGVATEAARKGVNHRLKHPYAKGNPERPSFRDTGLYQSSFRAWVEGQLS